MQNKFKSVTFWLGIISVVFMAADIDVKTLTDWSLLYESLKGIVMNPYLLGLVIINVYAQFNSHDIKKLDIPFKRK